MSRPSRSASLIQAGIKLLGSRSYRDITLDDVAKEAGVTRGLLLYYFGTRENFFLEVAREAMHSDVEAFGVWPEPGEQGWLEQEVATFIKLTRDNYTRVQSVVVEMAGVEGIRLVLDEINTFTAERVCRYLGMKTDNELLIGVLRAWGRACVDLALRGIPAASVTDEQLKRIMVAHVRAVVDSVLAEPSLED